MDELMQLGVATTPVTVIDGEIVVGFDQKRLVALLGLEEGDETKRAVLRLAPNGRSRGGGDVLCWPDSARPGGHWV